MAGLEQDIKIKKMGEPVTNINFMSQETETPWNRENGLLSYENPNYHLDPARFDDALNSNSELYEEFYPELDSVCNLSVKEALDSGGSQNCPGRRSYANLDLNSMGVDVSTGPITMDNRLAENHLFSDSLTTNNKHMSDVKTSSLSTEDIYAVPVKRRNEPSAEKLSEVSTPEKGETEDLPPGWEKHDDNDGPYYWHIKSGTIQREAPLMITDETRRSSTDILDRSSKLENSLISSVTRSSTSSALDQEFDERKKRDGLAYKRRSYPIRPDQEIKDRPIRFAVRSLGWVEIAEEDLTPERSSKAVNKCIIDLSLGRNDLLDVVGRWGDGKDLFMDLDEGALKLMDPENLTTLNTQPIHTIRVWGVGRDNGRDFAYVARDRSTRKHMCHVFRCDIPARTIANTLRDICKKIMIERSLQQSLSRPFDEVGPVRPTDLPTERRRWVQRTTESLTTQSFPTPMEEPRKVLRAQYLGSTQVTQASGMQILNDAIELLASTKPMDEWVQVNVAVAPSMISILKSGDENKLITECRVRYLSFLGIGKNVKHCAFIMHTAQDQFMAHVFYCEPSSGALCKTVEAACKLRYQKCLDAHPGNLEAGVGAGSNDTSGRGLGATLKSLVGSLTGRRARGVS